jgi:hypothetical protein
MAEYSTLKHAVSVVLSWRTRFSALLALPRGPYFLEVVSLDIKLIGMATVASLCDAVAEIMTGQPSYDEKAALLTEVECDNRAEIERFYGGARAAFKKDPGNGVSLFLLVSLDDIRTMPAKERVRSLDEILSLLEAALKNGYVTDQDAIDVVGKVDELLNTLYS